MGASIVGCAISAWLWWLVHQVKVLKAQTTASSESLAQGYVSANEPCRCFYACFFHTLRVRKQTPLLRKLRSTNQHLLSETGVVLQNVSNLLGRERHMPRLHSLQKCRKP